MMRCMGCMRMIDENSIRCPHCGFENGYMKNDERYLKIESVISGRYIIGKALGSGGFGITYIAWDTMIKKVVAIKEYFPSSIVTRASDGVTVKVIDPEMREQFNIGRSKAIEESRCLASLDNIESVTDVYDCIEENNTAYIIMEYLEGKTLKDLLKANGPLPFDRAMRIISPVIDSLAKVHSTGLIHRDISPDNIFLCKNGAVKILDFGSARYAMKQDDKTLTIVLKHGFAPVEQYSSHSSQGPWTDVYAVAATFYMMITGKKPIDSIERIEHDSLMSPAQLGAMLPQRANEAIMSALAVDARNRTRSMENFKRGLLGMETKPEFKGQFDKQYQKAKAKDDVVPYKPDDNPMPDNGDDTKKRNILIGIIVALVIAILVIAVIITSNSKKNGEDETTAETLTVATTAEQTVAQIVETTTEEPTTEETTTEETTVSYANAKIVPDTYNAIVSYVEIINISGEDIPTDCGRLIVENSDDSVLSATSLKTSFKNDKWSLTLTGKNEGEADVRLYFENYPEISTTVHAKVILGMSPNKTTEETTQDSVFEEIQ